TAAAAGLFWANGLFISHWERTPADPAVLRPAWFAAAAGGVLSIGVYAVGGAAAALAGAASAVLLAVVATLPPAVGPTVRRVLADAVLLTPPAVVVGRWWSA
ncbi:MAG: hypothetical protein ACRC1K_20105, partial [Planctomycetia bacterium]